MQLVTKPLRVSSLLIGLKWHGSHVSETGSMDKIKTFVFLDSETTGLPHLEYNKTRMTELCLVGVESDCVSLGVYPRIQNKLNLCFNPRKLISSEATKITGLCNESLQYQASFSSETVALLNMFLDKFRKPICFVAHNGNRFDYPILQSELHRAGCDLQDGILCIDSLLAFRDLHMNAQEQKASTEEPPSVVEGPSAAEVPFELQDGFDVVLFEAVECLEAEHDKVTTQTVSVAVAQKHNETTPPRQKGVCSPDLMAPVKRKGNSAAASSRRNPNVRRAISFPRTSFKLVDVYRRLTQKEPEDAHEAEGDVRLLIHCAAMLGEDFVTWANCNCQDFAAIPKMTPGRKIGS